MPFVFVGFAFASHAERLAGAASSPDWLIIGPPCKAKSSAPATDSCEEVALPVSSEVVGPDFNDASLIYIPWRDVAGSNEIPQPLSGVRVDLVVVGAIHSLAVLSRLAPGVWNFGVSGIAQLLPEVSYAHTVSRCVRTRRGFVVSVDML